MNRVRQGNEKVVRKKRQVRQFTDRFLVFEKDVQGPRTHALIIGVGKYPHLCGGTPHRKPSKWNDGMGQLTSSPISARKFADWIITDYRNSEHPLATVALLISDKASQSYTPPGGNPVEIEPATMRNVKPAVLKWKRRGDESPDNLLLFYFCGHGALTGSEASLMLEDFAANDDCPLDGAIDFRNGLWLGMDKCAARQQVYFIDACRVATSAVLDAHRSMGNPIVYGSQRPVRNIQDAYGNPRLRMAPVYYSALAGAMAYAREGQVSQYTEALLRALGGSADNAEADEKYRVDTAMLNRGIDFLLRRAVEKGDAKIHPQVNEVDHAPVFTLHELAGPPIVPVAVGCDPEVENREAELYYTNGVDTSPTIPGSESGWDVELTPGSYMFVASTLSLPTKRGQKQQEIRPPFRRVKVEVRA